jgi:hypothetical protein
MFGRLFGNFYEKQIPFFVRLNCKSINLFVRCGFLSVRIAAALGNLHRA